RVRLRDLTGIARFRYAKSNSAAEPATADTAAFFPHLSANATAEEVSGALLDLVSKFPEGVDRKAEGNHALARIKILDEILRGVSAIDSQGRAFEALVAGDAKAREQAAAQLAPIIRGAVEVVCGQGAKPAPAPASEEERFAEVQRRFRERMAAHKAKEAAGGPKIVSFAQFQAMSHPDRNAFIRNGGKIAK
ncbi:MAG: hypothetical protein KIT22_18990, partial [Verrucomicrobiae bacterium]|nr:hypothetical protein [Verrucomicrobiae bacterium]